MKTRHPMAKAVASAGSGKPQAKQAAGNGLLNKLAGPSLTAAKVTKTRSGGQSQAAAMLQEIQVDMKILSDRVEQLRQRFA